jgi:hypothetical protein
MIVKQVGYDGCSPILAISMAFLIIKRLVA